MQATENPTIQLPGGQTLYPYQIECLRYLAKQRGRVLIGDDMGVGKTAEAMAWMWLQPRLRPVVIVCPANIKLQWQRALVDWLQIDADDITVMRGRKGVPPETPIIIINYDILKVRTEDLEAVEPKMVVFDESHKIKEATAARSKAAKSLATLPSVTSVLGMTGTPVINRPKEIWHQLYCINPYVFPDFYRFAMRYCNPKYKEIFVRGLGKSAGGEPKKKKVWDFTGASHLDELEGLLKDKVLIRRTKAEVLTDLPDYQSVTIPFEVDLTAYHAQLEASREELRRRRDELLAQRREIEDLPDSDQAKALAARAELNSTTKMNGYLIAEITLLKKEAALAKLDQVADWIGEALEAEVAMVLFTHHHEVSDKLDAILQERWPDLNFAPIIDGRMTNQARRLEYAGRFGAGEYPVLICGIQAMGQGVDGLQHGSSHCAFVELAWSPAEHDQAASRLHRIGQENAVTGYYLLSAGTIEEQIARVVDAKATVVSAVVGEFDERGIIESLAEIVDLLLEGE